MSSWGREREKRKRKREREKKTRRTSLTFSSFIKNKKQNKNRTFAQSIERCASQYSTAWRVLTILSAVAGAAAIGLGAWRRMQMREKFGIRGSAVSDLCAWLWCSPCALCQETRTLELRGVREGVWLGADPLAARKKEKTTGGAVTEAPKVVEMPSKVV